MLKKANISDKLIGDEVNLIEVIKTLWINRKTIITFVFIFGVIGLIYALQLKNYYTASSTFIPVTEGKSVGGRLGGLASLAGINIGRSMGSVSDIPPELYPEIVTSVPFGLDLINTKIKVKECDSLVSYKFYYNELQKPSLLSKISKYTIGLPNLLLSQLGKKELGEINNKNKDILELSQNEFMHLRRLNGQINLEVSEKEGILRLNVTMPEGRSAAQMTKRAQELLQDYVLRYKTQKSIDQLKYIEERFQEKEQEFEEKKLKLALFQDRNNNINSAVARTRLLQLQSEYDLAFSLYTELATQLETQRLQVKKDTPIFTVLKPVSIPNEKSGPKKKIILLGFLFFGMITSVGYIYFRKIISGLLLLWRNI